jgi:hypothetical protein
MEDSLVLLLCSKQKNAMLSSLSVSDKQSGERFDRMRL